MYYYINDVSTCLALPYVSINHCPGEVFLSEANVLSLYLTRATCVPSATNILHSPIGVAMPQLLESKRPPICVRLQLRWTQQSSIEDSIRKAQSPSNTLRTPSSYDRTNTDGFLFSMKRHIFRYVSILESQLKSSNEG